MTIAWVVHGVTASTNQTPSKGKQKMPRLVMSEQEYPLTPQAQRAVRRKVTKQRKGYRIKLLSLIGGASLLMTIPVYSIVILMPLSLMAFTVVSFITLSLCMAVVINDRNKEIADIHKEYDRREEQQRLKYRADSGDYYWDDINKTARRQAQSDLQRKRRAAQNYLSSISPRDQERGMLMLNQCAAEEKAGLAAIPELRIGTAERERVINKLGDHYAAGRLDRDELDTRMDVAAKAKTAVDLATLLRDLP